MIRNRIGIFLLILISASCSFHKKDEVIRQGQPLINATVGLNKGAYKAGEEIVLGITLENRNDESIIVEELGVEIKHISNGSSSLNEKLKGIKAKWDSHEIKDLSLTIDIPKEFEEGVYGVYITQKEKGYKEDTTYETFFRILGKDGLTVFDIETLEVDGIPVYTLDGGMSAEYVVEKSAANLSSAISHSWEVNAPGSGPNHVLGTPDFLSLSLNNTVDFYNKVLGKEAPMETVIISPGIPSMPYISNALKAPVLPLHFLVSVNTVKEIQTILQTANDKGIGSYATLSHDPSVPFAVSWVKILELPEVYKNFIKQHKVKNVLILGAIGTSGGETKAKRILNGNQNHEEYAPESIYIMYPGTSTDDVATLNEKIVDLKEYQLEEEFIQIADWESGINPVQIENFIKDSKSIPDVTAMSLLAEDLGELYNLGTYSTLALMAKNEKLISGLKGIIFNPYLIAHPNYELKKGFVPILYWQLVGANYTIDRMEEAAFKAVKHYFPSTDPKKFTFWLNATRNFGASWSANNLIKELESRGYSNFIESNYGVDEVWNPNDGLQGPTEKIYEEIRDDYEDYKVWGNSLESLNMLDYQKMSVLFGGFKLEER